jgi:phage tail-like protein
MADFQVNSERLDPYKNFEFRLKWHGEYVAGFSECTMLEVTTEVITHRDGSDPSTSHKTPGLTEYEAITLERGVTHDTAFANWAGKVWSGDPDRDLLAPPEELRDDIILEILSETGQRTITHRIHRCWPSEYRAVPDSSDDANSIAIQHIKLQCEGWEEDQPVTEPACSP